MTDMISQGRLLCTQEIVACVNLPVLVSSLCGERYKPRWDNYFMSLHRSAEMQINIRSQIERKLCTREQIHVFSFQERKLAHIVTMKSLLRTDVSLPLGRREVKSAMVVSCEEETTDHISLTPFSTCSF